MPVQTTTPKPAATTAASVGVNTPNFRPTSTMIGSTIAHVDSCAAFQISAPVARGGGWMFSFLATSHQVTAIDTPIRRPGTIPARNSLLIETLAATPKMTKPIDGGITGAMIPAEAMRPPALALSWPALTIIGNNSEAKAAVSATADPDSAAIRQAAI